MATPNVGILTNVGKNLIDQVNAGKTKITFSKIVFSSMDNSQLSDMQVKALTAIAPQEVVVSSPETTLDTNSGETRIRATGTNEKLADGVYVKTYGVFAKDDTGSEILYGVTVSPNPNYFPAYDGVTPQAVTYSYKTVIQETSNITMTNSNDVYASQEDLTEALQPYAKTVDVNQQLDKKVNIADMRKPARDVAGIAEVNAKQDKIGYTPADDSKVVHDNHDNTITANSLTYDLSKTDITPIGALYSGSFNDLPLGTVFAASSSMTDGPDTTHAFTTTTFYFNGWSTGRKAQIAISDSENLMYFRVYAGVVWRSWTLLSDDSKVVHSTDTSNWQKQAMFNPGDYKIDEVNSTTDFATLLRSKYDKGGIVYIRQSDWPVVNAVVICEGGSWWYAYGVNSDGNFVHRRIRKTDDTGWVINADDSKVAHLSGANNFDTVPTVNNNPLLLASSLPSDLARTGSDQEFTGKNTFDTAPIDKKTGNPYITKDGVPSIPSDVARTSQQTNFPAGLQSGGIDVATAADIKSIKASAWRPLTLKNSNSGTILFKDNGNGTASLTGSANFTVAKGTKTLTPAITPPTGYIFTSLNWNEHSYNNNGVWANKYMGSGSGGVPGSFDTIISNGVICFLGQDDNDNPITFSPSELTTVNNSTACNPALVSISKV